MRDYVTQISLEDFALLNIEGIKNVLNPGGSGNPYPFVYAIHTDGDTYFDKKLNVSGERILCILGVQRIRRTRDYFEVFDGKKVYKIKKSETKAIYRVEK